LSSNNNNSLIVRDLYKSISHTKAHLIQSKEIATACICPYLFKMSYPFGVVGGERDYLVANTVHDIMSLAMPTTILENWQYGAGKDFESIVLNIDRKSDHIIEKAIANAKERTKLEGRSILPHTFEYEVQDRFHGLLVGLAKRIMKSYKQPKRALTEITITNVKEFQEGRIDAILEFDNDAGYGLIDWKTNEIDKVASSGIDRWQLIGNFLLANYRYTRNENDWSKCLFGCIVYYENAYVPRLPLKEETINKVKNERKFAYETLCGGRARAQKPAFCPICDRDGETSADCRFYRKDTKLALDGRIPDNYANIRRHLIKRRYLVLDERAETHKHKFVINAMIDRFGERDAIQHLENTGVMHSGYRLHSINDNSITLMKDTDNVITFLLEPRKVVRIIGKEEKEGGIPILACVSEKGFVKEVYDTRLVVELDGKIPAERAKQQLMNLPLIIMPDEINLTRRVLEPLHRFHKLAAEKMLPPEIFSDDNIVS
jgi:hypothetical protein